MTIELEVIGCYGGRAGSRDLSSYLLRAERLIALDAGSLCRLGCEEQSRLRHAVITHAHNDHWRDLQCLAYFHRMPYNSSERSVDVYASGRVAGIIRAEGFEAESWVPFHEMSNGVTKIVSFHCISPRVPFSVENLAFTAFPVNHHGEGGAVGYLVADEDSSFFYTGDTGPLDEDFWRQLRGFASLKAVFIDCSYPDEMAERFAIPFNHLSPKLVLQQLEMLARKDVQFYAVHMFPPYACRIRDEIARLASSGVPIGAVEQGEKFVF